MTKEQAQQKNLDSLYRHALADGIEMIEMIFHGVGRQKPQYKRFKVSYFGERMEA